ncbi:esterase-like activity of phytase family protein [Sphingomonas lenta]|uniref:Phytase-like domain-containing protein n=1 Tax=Sphingomonas lenta TaxID=1141887 RepID=A0A2A2SD52_9SPHN|nr:esterase-like activity of phytase family protein [Sphingomonas lenta]PAX07179.1 hypothetical protein CKY28_14165 [Sphingomonas lenta]
MRVLLGLLLVLLIVPGWSGYDKLPLPKGGELRVAPVALHPGDPRVRRAGRLRYLGGIALESADPGFGGFSALHVAGGRFLLLGDGGNLLAFRMGGDGRPRDARLFPLPAGPGTGWRKRDRDSESLAHDPATGRWWVGFENHDQIWRYAPGFARAERGRAPREMRRWSEGGGAEAMTRLADGRFVVISEQARPRRAPGGKRPRARAGLIFAGDPTAPGARPATFSYRPARGYDPVDMTELPDGRVLVLERGFDLPFSWLTRVAIVARGAIRPGAMVEGEEIARLQTPLVADNFEGVAVGREGGRTLVWLLSDDNNTRLQRTLLLKFALEG